MSLKLHKEYGVNPTIPKCIVCGNDKNEIALLGNQYKEQAPMSMVVDVKPCEKCQNKYLTKGVMLAEAKKETIKGKEYIRLNGKIIVIKNRAFKKLFPKVAIPEDNIMYCSVGIIDKLNEMNKENEETKNE